MEISVISGRELSDRHVARWAEIQDADPTLASPYFCPEFTQAVASVRDDVFVAILESAGEIVGFFPFQRNRWGVGRPVGGPLSDYHGLIVVQDCDVDVVSLARGCGLRAWDFDHLPTSQVAFRAHWTALDESHVMDLSRGYDGYVARVKAQGSDVIGHTEKHRRQFERRIGELRFEPDVVDVRVLEQLLAWKSAQYQRSGLVDVFATNWTRQLLEQILRFRSARFRGVLSALFVGNELVAAHIGMRSRTVWHWWFPSHNLEYARYSPGIALRLEAARLAPSLGVRVLDLGKGDTSHKLRLRTGSVGLAEGRLEVPSLATTMRKLRRDTEAWIRRSALMPLARIPGRLLKQAERRRRFE